MKDGLVIVHACDKILERFSDVNDFRLRIKDKVMSYLRGNHPLFYTPFTMEQKDFPTFLGPYRDRVNTILVDYPELKRSGFVYQATILSDILKSEGVRSVEVGGVYYSACVNVTCKVLEHSGIVVEKNREICH